MPLYLCFNRKQGYLEICKYPPPPSRNYNTENNNKNFSIIFVVVVFNTIVPHSSSRIFPNDRSKESKKLAAEMKCNNHKRGRSALYSHYFAENRFARRKYRWNQFRMTGSFRSKDSLCMRLRRNH